MSAAFKTKRQVDICSLELSLLFKQLLNKHFVQVVRCSLDSFLRALQKSDDRRDKERNVYKDNCDAAKLVE